MKTITYTFGILALLLITSSCTIEELESAKDNPQNAVTEQAKSIIDSVDTGDIDPPKIPPR